MRIVFMTMFPEMLASFFASPLVKRAAGKNIDSFEICDIRRFARGSYRNIDDSPCGGGAGMIMRYDVLLKALRSTAGAESHVVMMAPAGHVYGQQDAVRLSGMRDVVIICGHYEGVDARIYAHCDEIISMGDYVLSAGEYAAMSLADSIVRLQEGVLRRQSTENESFSAGLLEYPQYTRPVEHEGKKVPAVLLGGNHAQIARWRRAQSLSWTRKMRPDLWQRYPLCREDAEILEELDDQGIDEG